MGVLPIVQAIHTMHSCSRDTSPIHCTRHNPGSLPPRRRGGANLDPTVSFYRFTNPPSSIRLVTRDCGLLTFNGVPICCGRRDRWSVCLCTCSINRTPPSYRSRRRMWTSEGGGGASATLRMEMKRSCGKPREERKTGQGLSLSSGRWKITGRHGEHWVPGGTTDDGDYSRPPPPLTSVLRSHGPDASSSHLLTGSVGCLDSPAEIRVPCSFLNASELIR